MSILIEVFKDLVGMFLTDVFLTVETLVLVAVVAGLIYAGLDGTWAGLILTVGSLAVVIGAVRRAAYGQLRTASRESTPPASQ